MIGLLVGIEREKAHPDQSNMGIRTFLLITLLGAIAGGVAQLWFSAIVSAFAFGLILLSYFRQSRTKTHTVDAGLTTEFAAGIVFCLGYIVHQSPTLAAVAGPIVAVILFSKTSLHRFIRTIRPSELQAALLLFLAGVVVINLVPDKTIDPWKIFNPKKFGYLVLLLASLEFLSYVIAKIIGTKRGLLLIGFLGGFISSTAVLLSTARKAKEAPKQWRTLLASAVAAKLAAIIELILIVYLVSPFLLYNLAWSLMAAVVVGAAALAFLTRGTFDHDNEVIAIKSPLDWKGVLRLSVMLGAILAMISISKIQLGENASTAASFLTGLFELHGASLANATMHAQNQIALTAAGFNILLAIVASLVAKIVMAWIVGRGTFTKILTITFVILMGAVTATAYLTIL